MSLKSNNLSQRINSVVMLIFAVLWMGIFLTYFYYPEDINMFQYQISYFGATKSISGLDNTLSCNIFSITSFLAGLLFAYFSILIIRTTTINKTLISIFSMLIAICLLIMAYPIDTYNLLHRMGGIFLFIFSWLNLLVIYYDKRKSSAYILIFMLYPLYVISYYLGLDYSIKDSMLIFFSLLFLFTVQNKKWYHTTENFYIQEDEKPIRKY